jgi:phosphatidylinositol alpha-1,6-mannosyltransferase
MTRTLVVTNDYPPRQGGIQSYVHAMVRRMPADEVVVYASSLHGDPEQCRAFDEEQPHQVVRARTAMMLPTPEHVRRARQIARAERCDAVWFGASAPLGLMGATLRRAGVARIVATTHGHEAGWARLPIARALMHRIGENVDVLTYLAEYFRTRVARALSPAAAARMVRLPPGVDETVFHPDPSGAADVRKRLGLADRPVVVCVSRLVPRKGQDTLIRALPLIRARVPDAALLITGGGPYEPTLRRMVREAGLHGDVVFAQSVPQHELPVHYGAGDVFAMPCRTRRGGLDVEGLGIVYLEASATGLPVIGGDSGGAPDAVLEGESGYVVDGRSAEQTADRVATLLADPARAERMGARGREWIEAEWRWDLLAERLHALLDPNEPLPNRTDATSDHPTRGLSRSSNGNPAS